MLARTLMVQGTASSVGKSLLVTGLCRWFKKEGLRVAPFKSQNMALNAAVTPDGLEIGRAQAVQAEAAGLAPSVLMNPILLKPEGERRSQLVVLGKPQGHIDASAYHQEKARLRGVVADALTSLREQFDLVVIEGAGSPAEINLKSSDIVNMHVAELADAPVLLAGDIDRGGVFAAFVGTLELLEPHERARIAAFIVNKFRGELALLEPGLRFLHERTGKPVLGVVPYLHELRIADEDSVALEARAGRRRASASELEIAIVRLPRISNHDDFEPLEREAGVVVRYVTEADELADADLVVLPGTKNTVGDLLWLRERGLAAEIVTRARRGERVLGICGGCQMLGATIEDPDQIESARAQTEALGLLPLRTRFLPHKNTALVRARAATASFLSPNDPAAEVTGYEIHMGRVERTREMRAAFRLLSRSSQPSADDDGAVSDDGAVVGTMLHGLFENDAVRATLLASLRSARGLGAHHVRNAEHDRFAAYDRLEATLRASLDRDLLWRIVGLA
jgi:adenosylcobyric acid synthase